MSTALENLSPYLRRDLRTEEQAREDIAQQRLAELQARWKREGWKDCEECDGTGRVLHCHRLDQPDIKVSCIECGGHGALMVDFWEWAEAQS